MKPRGMRPTGQIRLRQNTGSDRRGDRSALSVLPRISVRGDLTCEGVSDQTAETSGSREDDLYVYTARRGVSCPKDPERWASGTTPTVTAPSTKPADSSCAAGATSTVPSSTQPAIAAKSAQPT